MLHNYVNILHIGDIFGKIGLNAVEKILPDLIKENLVDFVVANGENVTDGTGIAKKHAVKLFELGVDVITLGNHAFSNNNVLKIFEENLPVIKPYNLLEYSNTGKSEIIIEKNGLRFGIINPMGYLFLEKKVSDSPFKEILDKVKKLKKQTPIVIVDFHAEATSEKKTMGYYLDGIATAVLGTHTHVQTADEQILPNGTAYISDSGMTGPHDSIIGVKKELMMNWLVNKKYSKFEPGDENVKLEGVLFSVDVVSGKATKIERIQKNI